MLLREEMFKVLIGLALISSLCLSFVFYSRGLDYGVVLNYNRLRGDSAHHPLVDQLGNLTEEVSTLENKTLFVVQRLRQLYRDSELLRVRFKEENLISGLCGLFGGCSSGRNEDLGAWTSTSSTGKVIP
ncbi:uncharacterized protein LOC143035511 [Oratosquilla oratoria]|uniref:uncharacterized protein LOC143035511 n=1 Tax=Oratosquilla oratoria TaxID=337810 RepID=UPI003F76FF50